VSGAPVAICFVVAAAENGVIGNNGQLPWRMPSDLKLFRKLTMGKPILMGRKTFNSIGKALDGRDNIVVTRDRNFSAGGVLVVHDLDAAVARARSLAAARGVSEAMVIGGADIFRALMPVADRIYLTRVHASPRGDTYFYGPDPGVWRESAREPVERNPNNEFDATFLVFDRIA